MLKVGLLLVTATKNAGYDSSIWLMDFRRRPQTGFQQGFMVNSGDLMSFKEFEEDLRLGDRW